MTERSHPEALFHAFIEADQNLNLELDGEDLDILVAEMEVDGTAEEKKATRAQLEALASERVTRVGEKPGLRFLQLCEWAIEEERKAKAAGSTKWKDWRESLWAKHVENSASDGTGRTGPKARYLRAAETDQPALAGLVEGYRDLLKVLRRRRVEMHLNFFARTFGTEWERFSELSDFMSSELDSDETYLWETFCEVDADLTLRLD